MIGSIDKLLLSASQQAEIQRLQNAFRSAESVGDRAGMEKAHAQAEQIRASAGYSGGASGDRYELLKAAESPAGFQGYEKLLENTVAAGMSAIAAGYEQQLSGLAQQKAALQQQGIQDQAAARSAAWNTRRLAADGLLTRGLEGTGVADVITATALNQAAANAYQALLERQRGLAENEAAAAEAKADAMADAAALQQTVGKELAEGYSGFAKQEHELEKLAQDYYYKLALQQLKLGL